MENHVHCSKDGCSRLFLSDQAMADHADAVHTFDDIRRMVAEKVREQYAQPATMATGTTWAWVEDLTNDWVVYSVEEPTECNLYKASYSILDNVVTLGDPTEVDRRTVYEEVSGG